MLKNRFRVWVGARLETYRKIHPNFISSVLLMCAAGAAALVAIVYAHVVDWATMVGAGFSQQHPIIFFCASPFLFILAWSLVRYYAPEAAGSGIPQVLADIELSTESKLGRRQSFWSRLRLILVKIGSSTLALLGGGILGREGPTIQVSAAIFEMFDGIFKRYLSSRRSREALLIAGGGAGLAAAFNTPVGGVVFAIEELASQHLKSFKGPLILAVVTAGYVTQAVYGPYLFLGHPAIGAVTAKDTVIGLSSSVLIGVVGAFFGVCLFKATSLVQGFPTKSRIILVASIGLVMSLGCITLGPEASGGGNFMIRDLLFESSKTLTKIGWLLAVWRFVGAILTYLSGCAGGIFAPSLAAGAALGAVMAQSISFDNPNLMIVLAMIAFLTGVTRSPFTSFILVFEMTDRQAAVLPMMAAALIANLFAKFVDSHSFYEKMRDAIIQKTRLQRAEF